MNELATPTIIIRRPKFSHRQKMVNTVIQSVGMCVRVRNFVKNINGMTTPLVKGISAFQLQLTYITHLSLFALFHF